MRAFTGVIVDATLLEPISAAKPSGEDIRHDVIYSEISARVRWARGEAPPDPDDPRFMSRQPDCALQMPIDQ
jgi:hypothetical protein